MFTGEYNCKIDAKNRFVIPSSFRSLAKECGGGKFVLRRNIFSSCIDMYPIETWELMGENLRNKLNMFERKEAAFMREWYRGAFEVEMDSAGRLLLPKRLVDGVIETKSIILLGQYSKLEIWDENAYLASAMSIDDFASLAGDILV